MEEIRHARVGADTGADACAEWLSGVNLLGRSIAGRLVEAPSRTTWVEVSRIPDFKGVGPTNSFQLQSSIRILKDTTIFGGKLLFWEDAQPWNCAARVEG